MTNDSNEIHVSNQAKDKSFLDEHARSVMWLALSTFLILSSILFASLFEWGRYHLIADPMAHIMSPWDKILLFWFLTAKSLVSFLPFLALCGFLIIVRLRRTAATIFNLVWIFIFAVMTADLVAVSFVGCHAWEYLLDTDGTFRNAWGQFRSLMGERASLEILFVVSIFAISGPLFFLVVRWMVVKMSSRIRWLVSPIFLGAFTLALMLCILGVIPEQTLFRDRIYDTLPLPSDFRDSCEKITSDLAARLRINHFGLSQTNLQNH